jgi:hypothetical protein
MSNYITVHDTIHQILLDEFSNLKTVNYKFVVGGIILNLKRKNFLKSLFNHKYCRYFDGWNGEVRLYCTQLYTQDFADYHIWFAIDLSNTIQTQTGLKAYETHTICKLIEKVLTRNFGFTKTKTYVHFFDKNNRHLINAFA